MSFLASHHEILLWRDTTLMYLKFSSLFQLRHAHKAAMFESVSTLYV